MVDPRTSAFIAHETRGRLRLKIPEKRGDTAYFARLAEQLAQCPGITRVEGKTRTGSILIFHAPGTGAKDIAAYARQSELFFLIQPSAAPQQTLLEYASAGARTIDRGLSRASRGFIDLPSALLIALLVMAVRQTAQGQIMIPAASLLWYAAGLITSGKHYQD
jgi:hypothetical protein